MAKNKFVTYPAVFSTKGNENGEYSVIFPDVPDTSTYGSTLEEAYSQSHDALGIALPDYNRYPVPTPLNKVIEKYPNDYVLLVTIDMNSDRYKVKEKTVRKNVTIPESIADKAVEKNINFSAVLTEALKKRLEV